MYASKKKVYTNVLHFVIFLNILMKFKEIYVCLLCKIRDQIEIINTLIVYETLAFSSNTETFSLFTRSLKRKSKLALRHKKHNIDKQIKINVFVEHSF